MHKFESDGRNRITERGMVFTVLMKQSVPKSEVFKKDVEIDGKVYRIKGIERFTNMVGKPNLEENEHVGLMVKDQKESKIRTTVYLDRSLLRESKVLAVNKDKSLSEVISNLLKEKILEASKE